MNCCNSFIFFINKYYWNTIGCKHPYNYFFFISNKCITFIVFKVITSFSICIYLVAMNLFQIFYIFTMELIN